MNNSLLPAGGRNINIIGRRGGSRNINITSCSRDIAVDGSIIISGSLSGRESRRRKEDLLRDPVVTLNSTGGDRELPEPGVSEGGGYSGIGVADNDYNMTTTTKQPPPPPQ